MGNIARFREFVRDFTKLTEEVRGDEQRVFVEGKALLHDLITHDDWLPERFAQAAADTYRQYLLYCDPLERFSVASFVWGPGHRTPVHDHTVWGMVGVMRGLERCEEFRFDVATGRLLPGAAHEVPPGGIDLVSPTVGDIHRVSSALPEGASVSIHVYGANIGAVHRHCFEVPAGTATEFVSGYTLDVLPNLWDRSRETATA